MDFIPKTQKNQNNFGTDQAIENSTNGGHGGLFATLLSAIALFFSGLSYYDSSLKAASLSIFVPPMIHYARDGGDVFNIPITITNDGAETGTVLSMELLAENLTPGAERKSATFHSIFLGDYPRDSQQPLKSFAPISVHGGSAHSETVRFYNSGETMPLLITDKGNFRFTLKVTTDRSPDENFLDRWLRKDPKPLVFEMSLPYFNFRNINANATIALFNESWSPAVSQSGDGTP